MALLCRIPLFYASQHWWWCESYSMNMKVWSYIVCGQITLTALAQWEPCRSVWWSREECKTGWDMTLHCFNLCSSSHVRHRPFGFHNSLHFLVLLILAPDSMVCDFCFTLWVVIEWNIVFLTYHTSCSKDFANFTLYLLYYCLVPSLSVLCIYFVFMLTAFLKFAMLFHLSLHLIYI